MTIRLIYLLFFICITTNAQDIKKLCKTCGKPLAQCEYKGEHKCKNDNQTKVLEGRENGHIWVDLGLSVKWATCNLGSNNPEGLGGYYSWGETYNTKNEEGYNPNYKYNNDPISIKNIAHTKYDAATSSWGGTWSIPTENQMRELVNKCKWTWTKSKNVSGYVVKGPSGKSIFLPATFGSFNSLKDIGTDGNYWCSDYSGYGNNNQYACHLVFIKGVRNFVGSNRILTLSIRPVCR